MAIPFREAIIRRDENKCQICDKKEKLQVHHIKHRLSSVEDLITLCNTCHSQVHLVENALKHGLISYFSCVSCKSFLLHYMTGNREVIVCPECGLGSINIHNVPVVRFQPGNKIIKKMFEYYREIGFSFDIIKIGERPGKLNPDPEEIFGFTDLVAKELTKSGKKILYDPKEALHSFVEVLKNINDPDSQPVIDLIEECLSK